LVKAKKATAYLKAIGNSLRLKTGASPWKSKEHLGVRAASMMQHLSK